MVHDPRRFEESFDLVELARRLANVVRFGTVADVDHDAYRLRACYDTDGADAPILTAPIPWVAARAGDDSEWWSPDVGEQVVLLAPSGELTQAIALPALYSNAHPAPSTDPDKRVAKHSDGAVFEYDRSTHRYSITLPAAGEMVVTIGGMTLTLNEDVIRGIAPEIRWNA